MHKKVLVVDDIPINCKILVMHLNKLGIASETASNGEEAVALCMRNRYSIILMDLDMPVMDGFKATKLIRVYEQSLGIRTPIVAVSSFDNSQNRQRCIGEGLDGLMEKGLNSEELMRVIGSYSMEDTMTRSPALALQRKVRQQLDMDGELAQLQCNFGPKTAEIVSEFIFMGRSLFEEFESAIANRSSMQLTHVAYSIKGSCSSLGLNAMAHLCAEIADDGYAGRWQQVSRKYRNLLDLFSEVQNATTNKRVS
ncbi:MAG TPA: response regulator [Candidatus Obscuribacterales bacterium]